jgi:hypothetical protein
MKENKKYIILSLCVFLVVAIAVVAIFATQSKENDMSTDSSTDSSIIEEASLENGWREIPATPNTNDYGYGFVDDYQYTNKDDGLTYTVIDLVKTYASIYSDKIGNKKGEINNIFDETEEDIYRTPLFDKESYGEEGSLIRNLEIDLSEYSYSEGSCDSFQIVATPTDNTFYYYLTESFFGTEEKYHQCCYDLMIEILSKMSKEEIKDGIISMHSYVTLDTIIKAIDNDDFAPLYDGIMNGKVTFAYRKGDRFTRIEHYGLSEKSGHSLEFVIQYTFE